jgi:hypothetical protein
MRRSYQATTPKPTPPIRIFWPKLGCFVALKFLPDDVPQDSQISIGRTTPLELSCRARIPMPTLRLQLFPVELTFRSLWKSG